MDELDRARVLAWDDTLDEANYYEVLGVLEIADELAIRQAFHEFSAAFHPDAHPEAESELASLLRRVFQRGAEAYRILSHPELRADYDMALAKGQLRLGVPSAPPPSGSVVKSLDDLCRSASGKLHAREADRLISAGNLAAAKRELMLAMRSEDTASLELRERLEALDIAMFAMGN